MKNEILNLPFTVIIIPATITATATTAVMILSVNAARSILVLLAITEYKTVPPSNPDTGSELNKPTIRLSKP